MTSDISTEQAWEAFKEKRSFEKAASIQGQLDTMAAMIQDIKTDTERTASIVDQLQGDDAAIDYENANAEPEMPPTPMEGAGAEDMLPPEEVSEEVPDEGSAPAVETGGMPAPEMPPEEMPEEAPGEEPAGEPLPEEMPAMEDVPAEEPVEQDLIGKIKMLIANTDDPEQLKGLSDLLSTALSQSQPPVPMEGMPEETSFAESADDGEPNGEVSFTKKDNGIADAGDAEKAEETVEVKTEDAPEVATSTDSFKESDEVEEKVEASEEESEEIPEAENPVVEEIVGKVAEAVEGIVESVIEGDAEKKVEEKVDVKDEISDDTEPFEAACSETEKYLKSVGGMSFADMFAKRTADHIGVDGQHAIVKTESRPATKDDFKAGGLFGNAGATFASENSHKNAVKVFDKEEDSAETESFQESAEIAKSVGRHIPSFREMYADKGGFVKTAPNYIQVERPGRSSMVGGSAQKADLNTIMKSGEKKQLQIGYGVDPHEQVADDWARYRAIMGYTE